MKLTFAQRGVCDYFGLMQLAAVLERAGRAPGFVPGWMCLLTNGLMFIDINKLRILFAIKYGKTEARWHE